MPKGSLDEWLASTFAKSKGAPPNSKLGYSKGKWNSDKLAFLEERVADATIVKVGDRYYLRENAPSGATGKLEKEIQKVEKQLRGSGGRCTLAKLGAKKGIFSAVRQQAVDALLDSQRAVLKGNALVLRSALPTEESEKARILSCLKDSIKLHTEESLKAATAEASLLDEKVFRSALARLVEVEKTVARWEIEGLPKLGFVYGLLTPKIADRAEATPNKNEVAALEDTALTKAVVKAYRRLVDLTGLPDVYISSLQKETAVDMERLKAWLRAHVIGKGDGVLSTGDWAACSPEERAGAVELRGQPRLLVKLAKLW